MHEEKKLIEKDFSKEEIEDAEQIFPEPPNYSQVNGTKLGNHILKSIGWVWKNKKLVYNLSAPMQCGKTQTTLSAILKCSHASICSFVSIFHPFIVVQLSMTISAQRSAFCRFFVCPLPLVLSYIIAYFFTFWFFSVVKINNSGMRLAANMAAKT